MLKALRKNTKLVVWSVLLAFIVWGGYQVSEEIKEKNRFAGKAFGKKITIQEYNRFLKATQIFSISEKNIPDPAYYQQLAWQAIVFSQEAKKRKVEVTDEEVRQELLKILTAQQLAPENYTQWVTTRLKETPKQFEEQLREMLRIQKLMKILAESEKQTSISTEDAKNRFLNEKNSITLEMLSFSKKETAEAIRKKIKTPADWKNEAKANPDAFKKTASLPLETAYQILNIDTSVFDKIKSLEKGQFSAVFPWKENFAIFFVADKTSASEMDFENVRESYIQELKDREKQNRLLEKTSAIILAANIEDYLAEKTAALPSSSS